MAHSDTIIGNLVLEQTPHPTSQLEYPLIDGAVGDDGIAILEGQWVAKNADGKVGLATSKAAPLDGEVALNGFGTSHNAYIAKVPNSLIDVKETKGITVYAHSGLEIATNQFDFGEDTLTPGDPLTVGENDPDASPDPLTTGGKLVPATFATDTGLPTSPIVATFLGLAPRGLTGFILIRIS